MFLKQKILWRDHQNIEVSDNLGVIVSPKKKEEGFSYFSEVLDVDPNFLEALENMGQSLMENNAFARAISYFQKFLELKLNDTQMLNKLGACFFKNRKF